MNDWEDFRYALALARYGSMVSAASALGVTAATVSRHIERMSADVGSPIFEFRDSSWQVSDAGAAIVRAAEKIEEEVAQARIRTRDGTEISGKVVVNTLSFVNSYFLAPRLGELVRENPALQPVIDATERNVSLANGEADVGIRLLRPEKGRLVRRPISFFPVGLFGPDGACDTDWIGLPEWLDWLPEMAAAHAHFGKPPRLRVDAYGGIAEASLSAGLVGIVPSCIAQRYRNLRQFHRKDVYIERLGWCVFHETNRGNAKVRVITDWICSILPKGTCACGACELTGPTT